MEYFAIATDSVKTQIFPILEGFIPIADDYKDLASQAIVVSSLLLFAYLLSALFSTKTTYSTGQAKPNAQKN